jgi:hypothetical protein
MLNAIFPNITDKEESRNKLSDEPKKIILKACFKKKSILKLHIMYMWNMWYLMNYKSHEC